MKLKEKEREKKGKAGMFAGEGNLREGNQKGVRQGKNLNKQTREREKEFSKK